MTNSQQPSQHTQPLVITASATRPGVFFDQYGVVVGPWTPQVKRANQLLTRRR